ncbi:hypothetical protein L1277_001275 [Okibacterium sp. HSC-33S16]|uniref:hypothetical protein n=1 Tax=Okibacterium sp. HSC-33S16 TaxID=2910965 RepID=UPI00209DD034|nr:hypothetical protein [Okibacterium sp. HSC-33S16]MCP2031184.1 hypothetical protein [Okibacterium sp. HSC-33S16]
MVATTVPVVGGGIARSPILIGAVGGLAWAASLRGFMVEIAGFATSVSWLETFVGILLPGLVAGGLLGWAEVRRRSNRSSTALILAPLAFPLATLSLPGQLWALLTTGIGGGALAVPLVGMAGGYALAGRRRWARIVCGVLAVAFFAAGAIASVLIGIPFTARVVWVGILIVSLLAVLAWACSIPLARSPIAVAVTEPATHAGASRVAGSLD